MYYQTTYKSPVGTLFLVSDEENLIGRAKIFSSNIKRRPHY